jgi:hypothetical protein
LLCCAWKVPRSANLSSRIARAKRLFLLALLSLFPCGGVCSTGRDIRLNDIPKWHASGLP